MLNDTMGFVIAKEIHQSVKLSERSLLQNSPQGSVARTGSHAAPSCKSLGSGVFGDQLLYLRRAREEVVGDGYGESHVTVSATAGRTPVCGIFFL